MRRTFSASGVIALAAGVACGQPLFNYVDAQSTILIEGDVFADNGFNGLFAFGGIADFDDITVDSLIPGGMVAGVTYDWARFTGVTASDGLGPNLERTTAGTQAFITIDGDGTNEITFGFFNASNTDNFLDEFHATATAIMQASLALQIGGAAMGSNVIIEWEWSFVIAATDFSENVGQPDFPEDHAWISASLGLSGDADLDFYNVFYDDPDRPGLDFDLLDASGSFAHTVGGPMDFIYVDFDSHAFAEIMTMGQVFSQDGNTAFINATLVLRVIPAPATGALFGLALVLASHRRRNA